MTESKAQSRSEGEKITYRANDLRGTATRLLQNERLVVSVVLVLLIVFSVFDFLEDRSAGASSSALFNDVTDTFLPMVLLVYIWRFKPMFLKTKTRRLESDLADRNADLQHWKAKANEYITGLSLSIEEQLTDWQLTRAEKEVAMLLLKGFSLRELAELRGTSERTVRQQATRIYEKAGLGGRAELSAFFLEDLMLPLEEEPQQ